MERTDICLHSEALEQSGSTDMDGKYLTFVTDRQLFGIPIADVVQIVGMQEITQVPEFPSYAKGIINLHGSVTPLIDVRLRFGRDERAYDERTCIIVTLIEDRTVGLIVDEVDAVTIISDGNISQPTKLFDKNAENYLTGVANLEDKIILLLNTVKLLSADILINTNTIGGMENV